MLNNFVLFIVSGFLAVFTLIIYERVRFMTGKKMLTEKLIGFLEKVHRRTEIQNKIKKMYKLIN